jgi:hypothetical protein
MATASASSSSSNLHGSAEATKGVSSPRVVVPVPLGECIPEFLKERDVLIPVKCDVTFGGARFVDSFSWNLYHSMMTPAEFASRTCADLVRSCFWS